MNKKNIKIGLLFEEAVCPKSDKENIFSRGILRRVFLAAGETKFEIGLLCILKLEPANKERPPRTLLAFAITNNDGYCDHIYPMVAQNIWDAGAEIVKVLETPSALDNKVPLPQKDMEIVRNPFFDKDSSRLSYEEIRQILSALR